MPKTDIDYGNTIIYKIYCKDTNIKDLYVGHTTNFVQRKYAHKMCVISNYENSKLYKVIRENGGWENWTMDIVDFFNCNNQYEARIKEQQYFISLHANLNTLEPISIPKEKINKNVKKSNDKGKLGIPLIDKCYECEKCSKKYISKTGLWRHKQKCKTININSTNSYNKQSFYCESCQYTCNRKNNFNKHLLTSKHILVTKVAKSPAKIFLCSDCNGQFKSNSGLWYHKSKCVKINDSSNETESNETGFDNTVVNNESLTKLVIENISENREFQKKMLEFLKNNIGLINNNSTTKP